MTRLKNVDLTYLAAFAANVDNGQIDLDDYLTDICPECDQVATDDDGIHVTYRAPGQQAIVVLIGCEGYHVINPNVLGVYAPNWS